MKYDICIKYEEAGRFMTHIYYIYCIAEVFYEL